MKCEKCGGNKFSMLTIYCEDGTEYYKCDCCGHSFSNREVKPKEEKSKYNIALFGGCFGCFFCVAFILAGTAAGILCIKLAWQFLCYAWKY